MDQRPHPLPGMSAWEYDALKADIRRFGVVYPVVKDEQGSIIDGRQRERVCRELGLANYPVQILAGLSEDEKMDRALVLNQARRRLSRRQMRDLIAAELRRTPDLSNNWMAQILGTMDKTVEAVRRGLVASSEIPRLDRLRGKDGKHRPVTRVATNTAREHRMAQDALRMLGDDAPRRRVELRHLERAARWKVGHVPLRAKAVPVVQDAQIRLLHCPFQELERVAGLQPGSVSLILTDIPYNQGFLAQVQELAAFAARALVEGGIFVTYSGQCHLDRVMQALGEHMVYRWTSCSHIRRHANLFHPAQCLSFWKPVLIYSKGDWRKRRQWHDFLSVDHEEKRWHAWQQPLEEVERLIRGFSEPGDLVCDPCGGGFTTAVACKLLGDRRCVSCDIDEPAVARGRERLAIEGGIA
ncbi:MAG: hypothetical protein BGO49_19635 [Planctomycetales bacterium 71-10]|nr:MAG: hypothetical protein BGO49_19635 [Planctomycetales bacterium 71-10]